MYYPNDMGLFGTKPRLPIQSLCTKIVLGGEAGQGIKSAGKIIADTLIKSGQDVFLYDEYPSLIRGGHNSVHITFSPYPVYSNNREIDILVCLTKETLDIHKVNLKSDSIIIYDHEEFAITDEDLRDISSELVVVSVKQILTKNKYPAIIKNIIYTAASLSILGVKKSSTDKSVLKSLGHKKDLIDLNLDAIDKTYSSLGEYFNIKKINISKVKNKSKTSNYFMTGNDAISLGAIEGGLGFYSAYPMTPSSTILDNMSKYSRQANIITKQTEDEISAINMAIGASFAGVRAMTGTSGGGFSLMVEALGLAAITETPIVIVIASRPGPATGLPTWTGQTDLMFALHASQDEFPRVVLCPTDAEEAKELTFQALNIADKYQIPVIILSDKYLSESYYKFEINKDLTKKIDRGFLLSDRALLRIEDYKRYEITEKGISARSIPGQESGTHIANSDESDEKGYSEESSQNRIERVHKRYRKVENLIRDMPELNIYGQSRSKLSLITWGSTKGPCLEAVRRLQNEGIAIKLLALNYIEPFPVEEVKSFLQSSKLTLLVEGNYTGQLGNLIKQNIGIDIQNKLLKYDGRPLYPDEIVNKIISII